MKWAEFFLPKEEKTPVNTTVTTSLTASSLPCLQLLGGLPPTNTVYKYII